MIEAAVDNRKAVQGKEDGDLHEQHQLKEIGLFRTAVYCHSERRLLMKQ